MNFEQKSHEPLLPLQNYFESDRQHLSKSLLTKITTEKTHKKLGINITLKSLLSEPDERHYLAYRLTSFLTINTAFECLLCLIFLIHFFLKIISDNIQFLYCVFAILLLKCYCDYLLAACHLFQGKTSKKKLGKFVDYDLLILMFRSSLRSFSYLMLFIQFIIQQKNYSDEFLGYRFSFIISRFILTITTIDLFVKLLSIFLIKAYKGVNCTDISFIHL